MQVLWACCHNISFDTQCEGTRAWFMHQIISSYDDPGSFINTAVKSLKESRSANGRKIQYLSELLFIFAAGGSKTACKAISDKYAELYEKLLNKKKYPNRIFFERAAFESLCMTLAYDKGSFIKIAENIGGLFRKNNLYDGGGLLWLYQTKGKKYSASLEKKAYYLKKHRQYEDFLQKQYTEREKDPAFKKGTALSRWLKRNGASAAENMLFVKRESAAC